MTFKFLIKKGGKEDKRELQVGTSARQLVAAATHTHTRDSCTQ
jgi:hypothetical protein